MRLTACEGCCALITQEKPVLMAYLRGSARLGSRRPAGEGAVLLCQLVQAGLQALYAPVQLRHPPLCQLAHLGHLWRNDRHVKYRSRT